jgi:hypothetical protein
MKNSKERFKEDCSTLTTDAQKEILNASSRNPQDPKDN